MTDTKPSASRRGEAAPPAALAADRELDCKGLLCPLPVYQAARGIEALQPGQVLRIECTDPGSIKDFEAFARQRGHTLLSAETSGGVRVFFIRKEGDR